MTVFNLDGTVVSSSQLESKAWLADRSTAVMVGVILSVHPSDSEQNYTALNHMDYRGYRHECTVLAADYLGKQPDVLITNVIIPPGRHTGLDNFDEDLPRGCSATVDGSVYKDDLANVDYNKLDGEWCLVGFIGGNIENPFVIGWWSHPANVFDPATSGNGNEKKALKQFDPSKNKSRFVRRINGTQIVVNKEGSVYLDTSEANSSVQIKSGKLVRTLVDKGGHLQVDLCKKAQFELNWNEKEHKNPRLGAGSTSSSPQTDPDLLHADQPVSGKPKARETSRTFIRGKEYELLVKTSNFNVWCATEGSEKGELLILADESVTLTQRSGSDAAALVQLEGGGITAQAKDGSVVSVKDDQIVMATKSGGQISIIGDKMMIIGPGGSAMSVPVVFGTGVFGAMMGEPYLLASGSVNTAWTAFLQGLRAYTDAIKAIVEPSGAATGYPITTALQTLIDALVAAINAFAATAQTWTSQQVRLQ